MNRRALKLIKFSVIAIFVLYAIWIPLRNSQFSYQAAFLDHHMGFNGGYHGINTLEFIQMSVKVQNIKPDIPLMLQIGDTEFSIYDITLEDMTKIGAKLDFNSSDISDWIYYWPSYDNSQGFLHFRFKEGVLFTVVLSGECGPDTIGPSGVFVYDGQRIAMPTTPKELKRILGKPDSMSRSLHLP